MHHAEILALKLGEPFGSILLAVAVTVIEVGLIVSIMLSGAPGAEGVARDTVFAAVMIVLNGVIGLCLLTGGAVTMSRASSCSALPRPSPCSGHWPRSR